jgi:hypothetical protein
MAKVGGVYGVGLRNLVSYAKVFKEWIVVLKGAGICVQGCGGIGARSGGIGARSGGIGARSGYMCSRMW